MTSTTLRVKGMTCDGCVNSVKKALLSLPGVAAAAVDLRQGQATVTFDDTKATIAMLKEAVEEAGYDTQ